MLNSIEVNPALMEMFDKSEDPVQFAEAWDVFAVAPAPQYVPGPQDYAVHNTAYNQDN